LEGVQTRVIADKNKDLAEGRLCKIRFDLRSQKQPPTYHRDGPIISVLVVSTIVVSNVVVTSTALIATTDTASVLTAVVTTSASVLVVPA
jgi:hypothetical protein